MQITLLGTGSPLPDPLRAGPATLVRSEGTTLLVDCGRGVLMRLAGAGVLPPMLSAVLVTHLHSDHLTDLNDVITTHWVMNAEPVTISVFGPAGMREVVDATQCASPPPTTGRWNRPSHTDSRARGVQWSSVVTASPAPGSTSSATAPMRTCRR